MPKTFFIEKVDLICFLIVFALTVFFTVFVVLAGYLPLKSSLGYYDGCLYGVACVILWIFLLVLFGSDFHGLEKKEDE